MQRALVSRFNFTAAEAGYLVVHCRELARDIIEGKCPEKDIDNVRQWLKALIKHGAA